ncbi:MAG: hypothetical protein COA42_14190, partial [Alteromonadaceae bacterium]
MISKYLKISRLKPRRGLNLFLLLILFSIPPFAASQTVTPGDEWGEFTLSWSGAGKVEAQIYETATINGVLSNPGRIAIVSLPTTSIKLQRGEGFYRFFLNKCEFNSFNCDHGASAFPPVEIGPKPIPPPTVTAEFNKNAVRIGESANLEWSSTNADSCSATGVTGVSEPSGAVPASWSTDGTYTAEVTCTNSSGSASGDASIVVHPDVIASSGFSPNLINSGQSTTYTWNGANATNCSATGISGVSGPSGSIVRALTSTTTVTLTCTGLGRPDTSTSTVYVRPTANGRFLPNPIDAGQSTTYSWSSTNATNCSATGISGVSGPSGSITLSPGPATPLTVRLTCTGPGGSAYDEDTLYIRPTAHGNFSPDKIRRGESSTYSWSSSNATDCSASGMSEASRVSGPS